MRLNYVDRNTVMCGVSRLGGFSVTKLYEILDEFSKNEADFAEVVYEAYEYSSTKSAYVAVHAAIKRFGFAFRVRMIKGKLYLDKK